MFLIPPCFLLPAVGQEYIKDRYPIPSEDDYYQQREPSSKGDGTAAGAAATNGESGLSSRSARRASLQQQQNAAAAASTAPGESRERSPSISSQKKSKPMPRESSFFIFSSKNR